jgi:hypothetical protein
MTQFQQTCQGHVPYAQAVEAYRTSQAGMPPFGVGTRARRGKASGARRPRSSAATTTPHTTSDPSVARAYAALWLKPGAPLSVVRAAYRSLAAQTHPDIGGSPSAMRQLNTAYETLRRTLE